MTAAGRDRDGTVNGVAMGVGFVAAALALVSVLGGVGVLDRDRDDVDTRKHETALTDEFAQLQADQEVIAILQRAADADHATLQDHDRYARAQHTCRQHAAQYNAGAARGWAPANLPDRISAADFCGS
ncbi:hypothetical protein ACF1BS_04455 [Streptomyces sp. NPDC014748]|uniref:hypothetical protein n=1 Tax=Streptomyces sp. NPDC014748 TaxID=3364905 RepID=UPI0036FDF4F5